MFSSLLGTHAAQAPESEIRGMGAGDELLDLLWAGRAARFASS